MRGSQRIDNRVHPRVNHARCRSACVAQCEHGEHDHGNHDEQGKVLRGRTPLVRIPAANQEPFYRFLLTLNDQASSGLRLGIEDDVVHLTFAEPTEILSEVDAAHLFEELVRSGERLRKALGDAYETKPVVV